MIFNKRTHTCGELNTGNIGESVTLNGWIAKRRDLGGLLFIDLRDRYGLTQLKINPDKKDIYETALSLGNEFVISATGKVIKRESINKNIPTGEIEIDVDILQILNESEITPFVVEEEIKATEELRLQYRYLDLRRKQMTDNLVMRNEVYQIVHQYYYKQNFIEVETPVLMKSTPEGARDYLVPSRVHKGKFYALPQSPQTYKQLLMVSGLDRYVQICKCFRDEDLRADRQPEFTQIDVEMSFVDQEDIFRISEGLYREIWKKILNYDLPETFNRITYDEAMNTYGIDKPDFRIKDIMKITDITDTVRNVDFKVYQESISDGGIVAAVNLSREKCLLKGEVTRKIIDNYTELVKKLGLGGLGYVKYNTDGQIQSPLSKFLGEDIMINIKNILEAKEGDTVFIASGKKSVVLSALGQLRLKIAEENNLLDDKKFEFVWITDFPLFHWEEEDKCFVGEHHLFTMPKPEYLHLLDSKDKDEIESIRANCYDLVLNGNEIGSGSIRINVSDIQKKVFSIVGLSDDEANEKFGFLLKAFKFGAPPHGGVAFGFDRIISILKGIKSIREVIAFPKTVSASSLMDECPSKVTDVQLNELGLRIKEEK
ncbi:MAG: aspartate--tRNA ligase [Ignavibacteriae bacterium]|nr:aspartate--tRNA ligase [Ignavibacteriota bacterium]